MLTVHTYTTPLGAICYWTNQFESGRKTLVMLPGLTADHNLFDPQIEHFANGCNILVWDAPGHAESRPFQLSFTLEDKARWLHEILAAEGVEKPVLVGQSMGGYVSQAFMQYYPGEAAGFVSIDSAPLQRQYYPNWELRLLHHMEPLYRLYPWNTLVRQGAKGCAETPYGRQLMAAMMHVYDGQLRYYASLVGHGYRILAQAIEADLPYRIDCPCILICGEKDKAGDTKRFNRRWTQKSGIPIHWIPKAGHNSNTDQPELINQLIQDFLEHLL